MKLPEPGDTDECKAYRSLLTGCLVDFMFHLMNREYPMIVGANYPRDKLVAEFETWAASRNLNTSLIDTRVWMKFAKSGLLK